MPLNVEARQVWKPLHTQPFFRQYESVGGAVAEGLNRHGLCLQSSSNLPREEQDFVIESVRRLIA